MCMHSLEVMQTQQSLAGVHTYHLHVACLPPLQVVVHSLAVKYMDGAPLRTQTYCADVEGGRHPVQESFPGTAPVCQCTATHDLKLHLELSNVPNDWFWLRHAPRVLHGIALINEPCVSVILWEVLGSLHCLCAHLHHVPLYTTSMAVNGSSEICDACLPPGTRVRGISVYRTCAVVGGAFTP